LYEAVDDNVVAVVKEYVVPELIAVKKWIEVTERVVVSTGSLKYSVISPCAVTVKD
jgi:hypothetical protein